jgi:predicted AlkP superfamily phosphohydrolase/phosphomutase
MTETRVLIFGVDGATFDLVRPWAEAGHLPTFARLMESGAHGDLESTLPPVTSPAWPTFMTGCNPGKHVVFDFIRPKGNSFGLGNSTSIRQPTLWQILSDAGLRVGAMNVPVTYPAQPVNGFMITGLLSPTRGGDVCYPADLISRYEGALGPYRIAPRVQYTLGAEEPFIADVYDLIETHGRWGLHLVQSEPWDLFMLHFLSLDVMQHAMWRFMDRDHPRYAGGAFEDAIREGYSRVDAAMGRIIDQVGAGTVVMVMSDHGFGPLHAIVNLNNYLLDKGLLRLKGDWWTRLKAFAFRHGITPETVFRWLSRLRAQNVVARVSKGTRNKMMGKFLSYDSVDWSASKAYSMGHVGQIYLNVAGREPHGIVRQEERPRVMQEVMAALRELPGEDGRPLVTRLTTKDETYHGEHAEEGPDLHVELDGYRMISFPLFATNGQVITQQIRGDSGCHRSEGVFIASGAGIQPGERVSGANLMDLAPTVLHLLGLPVRSEMDGRVLTEIIENPGPIRYEEEALPQVSPETGLDAEDEAEVEERLRSLGYL